jgi:hypothetical protein
VGQSKSGVSPLQHKKFPFTNSKRQKPKSGVTPTNELLPFYNKRIVCNENPPTGKRNIFVQFNSMNLCSNLGISNDLLCSNPESATQK